MVNLTTSIKDDCELIVRALEEGLGADLVAVALFGSYARGDSHPGSDLDLFAVAHNLPSHPLTRLQFLDDILFAAGAPHASFIATTPESFSTYCPPYYLDIATDAQILFDTDGFLADRLQRLRSVVDEAGLYRIGERGNFGWRWERELTPGRIWVLDWEGYRELA